MHLRILKRAKVLMVPALCVLSGILFGIQICYCDAALSTYYRYENTRLTTVYDQTKKVSRIECCTKCHHDSSCNSVNYNPGSRECQLSKITDVATESEISGEWVTYSTNKPRCKTYLVSGPDGVNDSQLTESDYWCKHNSCSPPDGLSAKYARLNTTGDVFTGGWVLDGKAGEYIQVDFLYARTISAIVLQGRYVYWQRDHVASFKVLTSMDCGNFITIADETGNDKIFEGNNALGGIVIRDLPEIVQARCVRINPMTWGGPYYIALRFDVLGC